MKQISWVTPTSPLYLCRWDCGSRPTVGEKSLNLNPEPAGAWPRSPPTCSEMCASVFIFRWCGGEPIGSVCLHILVKTDVYLCEWQSYMAPTLHPCHGCVNTQKVQSQSKFWVVPSPHHVCSTLLSSPCPMEMSKEQWLPSVQDSILHPSFPFFTHKLMFLPSSFWLHISNLLVCLLRGACCTLSLWSFRKMVILYEFFMELVLINYPSVTCY